METLLVGNERAALVGNSSGEVRTEVRPEALEQYEHWLRHLSEHFHRAGRVRTNENRLHVPRALYPVSAPDRAEGEPPARDEPVPIRDYSDESFGLNIRAAFDRKTGAWIIALPDLARP